MMQRRTSCDVMALAYVQAAAGMLRQSAVPPAGALLLTPKASKDASGTWAVGTVVASMRLPCACSWQPPTSHPSSDRLTPRSHTAYLSTIPIQCCCFVLQRRLISNLNLTPLLTAPIICIRRGRVLQRSGCSWLLFLRASFVLSTFSLCSSFAASCDSSPNSFERRCKQFVVGRYSNSCE